MKEEKWCLCQQCIDAIRSRGEQIFVGPLVFFADDIEYGEEERKCDWCEEVDDLYECL